MLSYRRFLAFCLDLICLLLLMRILGAEALQGFSWLFFGISLSLIWSLFESLSLCSPGKWLLRLRYQAALEFNTRFASLWLRSLLKFGILALAALGALLTQDLLKMPIRQGLAWPTGLILPVWLLLLWLPQLLFKQPSGLLHESFSKVRVQASGPADWQAGFVTLGLLFCLLVSLIAPF